MPRIMHLVLLGVLVATVLSLRPGPAKADVPSTAESGLRGDVRAVADLLAARLPEDAVQRLRDMPDRALAEAAEVVLGFGEDGAIGPEAIERAIAVDRAAARARRVTGLLAADLDNDGVITGAESGELSLTLSAEARGRHLVAHRAADSNADGAIDMVELRAYGDLGRGGAARADRLRALMAFDLDGDLRVTLDELAAGLRALQAPAPGAGPPRRL